MAVNNRFGEFLSSVVENVLNNAAPNVTCDNYNSTLYQ